MSLSRLYKGYSILMFGYGFTRGYRSDHNDLITGKFIMGIFNGSIYSIPGFNVLSTINLLNRIEIKYRNYDKFDKKYKSNYEELIGYCYDTI
jgi:hypothetical protein